MRAVIVTILIGLAATAAAMAQPSARVLSIDPCAAFLEVDEPDRFHVGDRVVIHQIQQTAEDTGAVAGQWETAVIEEILGALVFLDRPLSVGFDPATMVQVVRVDTASVLHLTQRVAVRPFRDGRGGLYAAFADTLVLNTVIDASGAGYPGGRRSVAGWDTTCTLDSVDVLSGAAGEVGHGPVYRTFSRAGRSSVRGGGGGGNARNSGGGGGALGGAGGRGGAQTSAYEMLPLGGVGGVADAIALARFGGGGGGGHQNDFSGSDGGAGGGAVILRARVVIAADGAAILANGADGLLAWNDGAGGGGAGGSVWIDGDTIIGTLAVSVEGGRGGETLGEWYCYGPGGGGGGGVLVASPGVANALVSRVAGGAAGEAFGVGPCEQESSYGAAAGTDGVVLAPRVVERVASPCREPDLIVRGGRAEASPGERVGIPIEVETRRSFDRPVRLTLWIRARASVLVPEGAFRWAGRHAAVRFHTISLPAGPPRTIMDHISYVCALGDSAEVMVRIDTAFVDDPSLQVQVASHGRFRLDRVCVASGRQRLFDPFAGPSRSEHPPQVYDVQGRRLDGHEPPDYHISVPGSPGTRLIVPR